MKYLPLIWAGLWCKPLRTAFTMVCIAVAFLLFGLLQGVDSAMSLALKLERLDRLFVDARFEQPLPFVYRRQIEKIPGIVQVAEVALIPGYYRDRRDGVLAIATDPEVWLQIRPEFHVPTEQIKAITRIQTGALVSDWLATKNGWKIGDHITIQSSVVGVHGTSDWTFEVVGIIADTEAEGHPTLLVTNLKYYDENRLTGKGTGDRIVLKINDPRHAAIISRQIDQLFTNSAVQTQTRSEHETAESEIASIGDIGFFVHAIMGAAFFTLLVLTSNTMAESVRERTAELAILRTLGFKPSTVLALIVSEALLMCGASAMCGLVLAAIAFPLTKGYVGEAYLPPVVIGMGAIAAIGVACLSTIIPTWRMMRLNIVNALAVR